MYECGSRLLGLVLEALFLYLLVWIKWNHKGNVLGETKAKHMVLFVSSLHLLYICF